MITYRILRPDEWPRLYELFKDMSDRLPYPESSICAIAEDENENILGYLFLQLVFHMEPLALKSPKISFKNLHDTIYDAIKTKTGLQFYVFSDKEVVEGMARHVGMIEQPYKVFLQEVK